MGGKIYKTLQPNDKVTKKDLLHEAIPLTGSIVSGTYGGVAVSLGSEGNIKNYSHGMFQSVYDYPYLSSSANHIFDIAIGVGAAAPIYGSVTSQKRIRNELTASKWGPCVTTIGLYSDDDTDLDRPLVVARLAKPIRMRQDIPITFRIRYDT